MSAAEGYCISLNCDDPDHMVTGTITGDGESADEFFGANKREAWKRARYRGWEGKGSYVRCPACSHRAKDASK